MNFNAATFLDTSNMTAKQVQALGHNDDVDGQVTERADVALLLAAAARFEARRDAFAAGKGQTCRDIAGKLEQWGSYASTKQADFARKLIEWSKPRQAPAAPVAAAKPVEALPVLPKLFALMQRLSKLTIGNVTIARKNQDSLCWVKWDNCPGVVGKIEGGKLILFAGRLVGVSLDVVLAALLAIEADPEAAAVLHGKASGRCSVCSRDLTDPASIERGIGPICAEKF